MRDWTRVKMAAATHPWRVIRIGTREERANAGGFPKWQGDDGDRYSAVLEDEVWVLTRPSLLLDWYVGRPLAKIGSLEMTP